MSLRVRLPKSTELAVFCYTAATRERYRKAVRGFVQFCLRTGENATTFDDLDDLLYEYIHFLFSSGGGKSEATNALYGVIMYLPRARHQLLASQVALRGWHKHCPADSYPPLTWELSVVIAIALVRQGYFAACVAVVSGFDCLLRIGELTQLRREDVVDSDDARLGSGVDGMWIRIRKAKTGRNQLVSVHRPHVKALVGQLVSVSKPNSLLFSLSTQRFRALFKSTCAALGLRNRYVPHSQRHGGATWYHMHGWSLEDVLLRGRWASVKSARIYINAGRALLMGMDVPPALHQLGLTLSRDLSVSFSLSQLH